MTCFFDTSGLIKNYIDETGTDKVVEILNKSDRIYVAETTYLECISTLRRLSVNNLINEDQYLILKKEIKTDFSYFSIISSNEINKNAELMIERYQLKTLDSIQLGSALFEKGVIDLFVCSDNKLLNAADYEGLKILNPSVG